MDASAKRPRLDIPYPVIVEGRYDRQKLVSVINAEIITTDGFGIFRNAEKQALLRALAARTPVIVLTGPDGAGGVIRSKICGMLPPDRTVRLYVPRVEGKEKRKSAPSAEGVLGVEGTDTEVLYRLFLPYSGGAPTRLSDNPLSAADLFRDGLTGRPDSSARRDAFGRRFGLPPGMNARAFLAALRFICTYEESLETIRGSAAKADPFDRPAEPGRDTSVIG